MRAHRNASRWERGVAGPPSPGPHPCQRALQGASLWGFSETIGKPSARVLALIGASPEGCPEALLLAHGFKLMVLADLVKAGLVIATDEHVFAGGRSVDIVRYTISDAGRVGLER